MIKRVLLTGGAGFIGSHVAEHILRNTDWQIVFLDRLDCSGNLNRITEIRGWERYKRRCQWIFHDLRAPINALLSNQIGRVDFIFHLAALTHVDRSIAEPLAAVADNLLGSAHILEFARTHGCTRLVYFSTDEVFGPAPPGTAYKEWDRYRSTNPYSATKAGGEELALAYHNTYGLPVLITHTMNVFGERQHPEKFIPSTIAKVRDGGKVLIHADVTKTHPGSRFYIHARNVAAALLFVVEQGTPGEKYNIVGEREIDNLTLAHLLATAVGKPLNYELVDFHSSRPGHDLRYALDGARLKAMGWSQPVSFGESLVRMVRWTLAHEHWLPAKLEVAA